MFIRIFFFFFFNRENGHVHKEMLSEDKGKEIELKLGLETSAGPEEVQVPDPSRSLSIYEDSSIPEAVRYAQAFSNDIKFLYLLISEAVLI